MMNMSSILVWMVITQGYAPIKRHPAIHFKSVHFAGINYISMKGEEAKTLK